MSLTDTSKSNGAWLASVSRSVMANSSVKQGMKSITLRWQTTTPLGVPVLPLVKLT